MQIRGFIACCYADIPNNEDNDIDGYIKILFPLGEHKLIELGFAEEETT